MKAIYKKPGELPEIIDIENSLEALQEAVGGYIETYTFCEDACVICDEEGRLKGEMYNTSILGVSFVGPILIVGVEGEEFADLTEAETLRDLLWPQRHMVCPICGYANYIRNGECVICGVKDDGEGGIGESL